MRALLVAGVLLALASSSALADREPVEVPACFYLTNARGDYLPDAHCTPGAIVDRVTQETIHETICVRGWVTANMPRPSSFYTTRLKRQQLIDYGRAGAPVSEYEEDHLIPRGSSDVANLWPEPSPSPNRKDRVENMARDAVCNEEISLSDAQAWIAGDWPGLADWLGVP
jgi:hypothetical protein